MYGFLELLKEKKLSEFNYNLLKEGLIKSCEYDFAIDKIVDLLNKNNINGTCKLYSGNDRICLNVDESNIYNKKSFYKFFINLLSVLGYFMSNYKLNNKIKNDTISFNDFIKNDTIIIYLNKKFDSEANNVPEFLYHVTEETYLNKILRYGLINKSKKYIENHPERIYIFKYIKDCYEYIDYKQISNPIILKIDVKTLNNIKIYYDPKYQPLISAYYTYDNIPPYSIIKL